MSRVERSQKCLIKTQGERFLSGQIAVDNVKNTQGCIYFLKVCQADFWSFAFAHLCSLWKRGWNVLQRFSTCDLIYLRLLFRFACGADIHQSTQRKTQKAPVSDRTSHQCHKLLCLLHPQLGAIGLTLTSNCGLCYFVHVQQEQQYSTYLADETHCQGHCVYRIPFRYCSNIPRSSPQSPQDPLLDIFSR